MMAQNVGIRRLEPKSIDFAKEPFGSRNAVKPQDFKTK